LQKKGFGFIVITNQSGISKGLYTLNDFYVLTDFMLSEYKKHGIDITDVYMCPHHPEQSKCLCRKPLTLLLERAIARYDAEKKNSYFIGDKDRDIEAGRNVGIKSIKIESNSSFLTILGQIL
jgi:D-glycero-D-manno-heptose 1,7-bisphosphate phosphatase